MTLEELVGREGYMTIFVLLLCAVVIFLILWAKAYWDEKKLAAEQRNSTAKARREQELIGWIKLADVRQEQIERLTKEIQVLNGNIADLKELLAVADKRVREAQKHV